MTLAVGEPRATVDLDRDELTRLVADAYRDAALRGANMRRAVEVLESIRAAQPGDGYRSLWDGLDAAVGRADEGSLQDVLKGLRAQFVEQVVEREVARVETSFASDPAAGRREWLLAYAEALDGFRWDVALALTATSVSFPLDGRDLADDVRRWTRLAVHNRWAEALPLLLVLADADEVPAAVRAAMCSYAVQVQLYHLFQPEQALPLLRRAEELAPDLPRVAAGWIEYQVATAEYDAAAAACETFRAAHPVEVAGYDLAGQIEESRGNLDDAERWYFEAMRVDSGDTTGYISLLRLYGGVDRFPTHEPRLANLAERIVAVDPWSRYSNEIELGAIYQQNGRYDEAQASYDRAIGLDRERLSAHTSKGYAYCDAGDYTSAERAFEEAIKVAPEAFDGYWGLASAYESEGKDREAAEQFGKSLGLRPEWRSSILTRRGASLLRLGDLDDAERDLLEALRLEPTIDTSTLDDLVAKCYDDEARVEASARILAAMRDALGESYEPTYRNLEGNIAFYYERYDDAARAYELAIAADPATAVYHSNFALAWEHRRVPGERAQELEHAATAQRRAVELAPDDAAARERLEELEAELRLVGALGEAEPATPPARLAVSVSTSLLSVILDESGELSDAAFGAVEEMRARVAADVGVPIPPVRFREQADASGTYTISIRGAALPAERLDLEHAYRHGSLAPLVEAGIPAMLQPQTLGGAWVAPVHAVSAGAASIPLLSPLEYLVAHLETAARAHLEQFVDHRSVAELLGGSPVEPLFVDEPARLTELVLALRALVREHVPVVAVEAIATEVAAGDGTSRLDVLARIRLLPEVMPQLPANRPDVPLLRLDPALEERLRGFLRSDGDARVLALPRRLDPVDVFGGRRPRRGEGRALVVEQADIRPFVWALARSTPNVYVAARDELLPERQALLEAETVAS